MEHNTASDSICPVMYPIIGTCIVVRDGTVSHDSRGIFTVDAPSSPHQVTLRQVRGYFTVLYGRGGLVAIDTASQGITEPVGNRESIQYGIRILSGLERDHGSGRVPVDGCICSS